jgi:RNA polymerase sigma-70 factor, ECF subfamily
VGDPPIDNGFSAAFDAHAEQVLRFSRRRLGDQDAAWDVVTETFTTAWRHWRERPEPPELLPWLYAIAGNAVRGQRRSAGRRSRLAARLSAAPQAAPGSDPADGVVLGQSLAVALAQLPERDQELLRLVAWEELTDARALGLVLGLSPSAVRVRLHRARRRLRRLLDEPDDAPAATEPRALTATTTRDPAREAWDVF